MADWSFPRFALKFRPDIHYSMIVAFMTDVLDTGEVELGYEDEDALYPIRREEVNSVPSPMTISDLMLRIKNGEMDLRPSYQRNYVWKDDKAAAIIDSIWNGIPIPQIFLLEKDDGTIEVIDGQQRITSIARFMADDPEYQIESRLSELLPNHRDSAVLRVPMSLFDHIE